MTRIPRINFNLPRSVRGYSVETLTTPDVSEENRLKKK